MSVVYAVLIFVGGVLGGCALKDEIARRAGARRARGARACPARRNRAPRVREFPEWSDEVARLFLANGSVRWK